MTAFAIATTTVRPTLAKFHDIPRQGRRYLGHGEDFVTRFHRLVRVWRSETAHCSSLDTKFSHPAYVEIVGMGRKVIPLIIAEIQRQPDWLFGALPEITGEDPIADADRGDLDAMISSWVQWASRRG